MEAKVSIYRNVRGEFLEIRNNSEFILHNGHYLIVLMKALVVLCGATMCQHTVSMCHISHLVLVSPAWGCQTIKIKDSRLISSWFNTSTFLFWCELNNGRVPVYVIGIKYVWLSFYYFPSPKINSFSLKHPLLWLFCLVGFRFNLLMAVCD